MRTGLRAFLVAVGVIVLLFLIGDLFGHRSGRKEPRSVVIELDTSQVIRITWESRSYPQEYWDLERTGSDWKGQDQAQEQLNDPERFRSPGQLAATLLTQFRHVPVKREMGMIKLLEERYALTDATLDRISFTYTSGEIKSLDIGSTTFAPGKVGIWTYVNIPGEKEVYAVEGALAGAIRKGTAFEGG